VRIILLTGGLYSIPSMHYLSGQKMLHSVISLGKPDKNNVPIEVNAQHLNLPFKRFLKDELVTGLKDWLIESQPEVVLVFGCGYKIPAELLNIPKFGFYNIHFSLLPAYRGKSPVFWQLKNGENVGGITIHQMTEDYDSGGMLFQQEVPISPNDSFGLYNGRLGLESIQLIAKGIEKLANTGNELLYPQNESKASYFPPPDIEDLKINWETQSAGDIENLVNAANPDYGGAVTLFRGQPFRILEVNQVQINSPTESIAGSIVHADINYGIIVACKSMEFLRINIVQSSEGIFSGFKLAALGIAAGERFESAASLFGLTINP
jgi:methionyl-tRNA formyltransferase